MTQAHDERPEREALASVRPDPPVRNGGRAARDDALAPVRSALLERAAARAAEIRAAAEGEAERIRAKARREAAAIRAEAAALGRADGHAAAELRRTRAQAAARTVELGARSDVYAELRRRVRAAVLALRDDPGYPDLHAGLVALARGAAGPDARIDDAPSGGVRAEGSGVVVDLSLDRLAELATDVLIADVPGLWAP